MKKGKIIKDASALGQFGSAIAQICEEKGLEKERVVETIEAALAAAYKKDYGKKGQIIVAKMDEKTGEVSFKQLKEVVDETSRNFEGIDEEKISLSKENIEKAVRSADLIEKVKPSALEGDDSHLPRFNPERDVLLEDAMKIDQGIQSGDFLEIPLEAHEDYGRVASQTAKQVIIQRLREAERDAMYDEYKGKEGEIISGTVQRVEGRNVYIDLGKSVGVLFPSQQVPTEKYRIGQRIKVYIEKVESDTKGPGILLSRSHPELLRKLFELEVPEIFTKTVEIKSIAREAGSRSKIAVISNEEGVDPIGSCVGQKGTRVQSVIDEIGGEKIDIIQWSDDVEKMIAGALSPAKVTGVQINSEKKEAIAFVPKEQLSLAIGRRGQNVRLAAKLTGWRIDVKMIENEDESMEKTEITEEEFSKNDEQSKKKEKKKTETVVTESEGDMQEIKAEKE